VGFIASVSRPFCLNCNRIRLTADGKLRYCLFAIEETDVKRCRRGPADRAPEVDRPRDQHRAVRAPAPPDVLDRRLMRRYSYP
jgi:molybdenum cofactor biosynthesis enzyme MoaA